MCVHLNNQVRKEHTLGTGVLSAKDVAAIYKEHCVLAADSEPRTDAMIDIAMTIYKRVMQVTELKVIMLAIDDFPGSCPLNSVYKFRKLSHGAALPPTFAGF